MKYVESIFDPIIKNIKGSIPYCSAVMITTISYVAWFIFVCYKHSVLSIFLMIITLFNLILIFKNCAEIYPADTDDYYDELIKERRPYHMVRHYHKCKKNHRKDLYNEIMKYFTDENESILFSYYFSYPEFHDDIFNILLNKNKVFEYYLWINSAFSRSLKEEQDYHNYFAADLLKMKEYIIVNHLYDAFQASLYLISNDEVRDSLAGSNFYTGLSDDYQIGVVI